MRCLLSLSAAALMAVAACTTAAPTTTTAPDKPEPPASTKPVDRTVEHDLVVFLLADPALGELGPYLAPVHRTWVGETAEECAIEALLAGYTFGEVDLGISSAVPFETTILDVRVETPAVVIDLTGAFESGGGTASMHARLGQLVFTATQFDGVDRVELMLDGESVTVFSSEGLDLSEPLTREGFADLLAPVHVEYPAWEEKVDLPFTMRGTVLSADGGFTWDLVDWDGRILGSGGVADRGGAGERVGFDALIEADVSEGYRDPSRLYDGALIIQAVADDTLDQVVMEIPLRFAELR